MKKLFKKHFIAGKHNDHQPHVLRNRGIMVVAYFVLILFGLVFIQSRMLGISSFLSSILPNILVDLANAERMELQAGELTVNPLLVEAARLKANDMAEKGYFAHQTPDGKDPWYFFSQAGYPYLYAGENLAMDFHDSDAVNRAWMASPGHKENIVSRNFTEIGIATAEGEIDGRKTTFVVQMFGKPRANAPIASAQGNDLAMVAEPKVLQESDTFVAVQGDVVPALTDETLTGGAEAKVDPQSTIVERTVASPSNTLQYLYIAISVLLLLAIASIVMKQFRLHHARQIASGVALMGLMALLLFVTHSFLFAEIIIR